MSVSKLRQANAKNILAKIKAGKTVSQKQIDEAEEVLTLLTEDEQEKSVQTDGDKLVVGVKVLMKLYDVKTRKTIANWVNLGMPKIANNKYNLYDVFKWKRDRDETGKEIASDAKERYWDAKADNEEIKRDISKNVLIHRDEILPEWTSRVHEITQGLEGLSWKLPPILEGKSKKQIQKIIDKEIGILRDSYARTGKYTPKPAPKKTTKKKGV